MRVLSSGNCNLCSNQTNFFFKIKENSDQANIIKKYLPINVFPLNACTNCMSYIDEWNTFYENCSKINKKLENYEYDGEIQDSNKVSDSECQKLPAANVTKSNRIFKTRNVNTKKFHKCPHCNLTIHTTLKGFNEHLKLFHDSLSHCKLCNKYFPKNKLIPHITNHAINKYSNNATVRTLPACEFNITEQDVKLKNFKCELCKTNESNFSTNRLLQNHIQSCHSNERNYICKICNKGFKTDSSLYIHSKSHSDMKPFECKCGKSYKFHNHLKSHIQQQHLDEKLFDCIFCKKKFYSKNNLTKHIKIHEINDEFKCHICNSIFKQKRYLKEHLRKVHMKK